MNSVQCGRFLLPALVILPLAGCPALQPFQPDVAQGGRIVSMARSPLRPGTVFAAAESGGLFVNTFFVGGGDLAGKRELGKVSR